jgi:hypothetical protein
VIGTCRSSAKGEKWISKFPEHKGQFKYAVVEDMCTSGAFDEAVKGCDYIIHTASPLTLNPTVCAIAF